MLRILETEVECWCQHAHRKEDFRGATMIGLFGSNGAGKTNFREAMRFGIMGESANKGTKEADLMFGAKKGSVREVFEVNGVVSEVTRSIATAATHLRIGEGKGAKTFRKAKEVAVELQKLLGVQPSIINKYVFVPQGQIDAVLFTEPSKRKDEMNRLFGLGSAEKVRDILGAEINTINVVSHKAQVDSLMVTVSEKEAKLYELSCQFDELLRKLPPKEDVATARAQIQRFNSANTARGEVTALSKQLLEAKATLERVKHQVETTAAELAVALSELSAITNNATLAQQAIANHNMIMGKVASYNAAKGLADAARVDIAKLVPVDPEDIKKLSESVTMFDKQITLGDAQINSAKVFLAAFATGICPTCKQPIADAEKLISESQKVVNDMGPALETAKASHGQMLMKLDKQRRMASTFTAESSRLQGELTAAQGTMAECAPYLEKQVNEEQIDELRRIIAKQVELLELKASRATAAENAKANAELANKAVAEYTAELGTKHQLISDAPDEVTSKTAQKVLDTFNEVFPSYSEAKANADSMAEQVNEAKAEVGRLQAEEKTGEKLRLFRDLLDRAKGLLHKDALPAKAANRFMTKIALNIGEFLDTFQAPFTVELGEDLGFECIFPDKTQPANRLSFGERMKLGVCFQFAVNKIFAPNLGMITLDEPTAYLDQASIGCAVQLIEQVKEYASRTGMQIFVITHEETLKPVMDKIVQF